MAQNIISFGFIHSCHPFFPARRPHNVNIKVTIAIYFLAPVIQAHTHM